MRDNSAWVARVAKRSFEMNKQRQRILTGGSQDSYSRWQMPIVDGDVPQAPTVEAENPKPLTAVELESLQRKAYEEGFAAGHRDGFAQGERDGLQAAAAQARVQVEVLQGILRCLTAPLEALDEEVERSLVALALAIARQVVRGDLAARPEQILLLVRETLDILPAAARNVRLYLHPDDVSLVRAALTDEIESSHWVIREDSTLSRGGCRVESDTSRIDASVQHRLASAITQVLGREGGDVSAVDEA